MDARQRGAGTRQQGREHLLLAERAGEGRPRATPAPGPGGRTRRGRRDASPCRALPPAEHQAAGARRASGRRRLARDLLGRRIAPAGADHELPPGARRLPASGRRRRLDRPHEDLDVAVSGDLRAGRIDGLTRAGGGADRAAFEARRDVQQRLQAGGLGRRVRDRRPHLRAVAARHGDVRAVQGRPRRHRQVDRPDGRRSRRRVRAPEPAADRRSRQAQPQPERRAGVGRDARQRRARVAVGGRDRQPRQPDLRRRTRPGPLVAGDDDDPRRRGAGDGARHQHVLDELRSPTATRAPTTPRTCSRTWTARRSDT